MHGKVSPEIDQEALNALIELDRQNLGCKGFLRWVTHIAQTYSLLVVFGMVLSSSLGLALTCFMFIASTMAHLEDVDTPHDLDYWLLYAKAWAEAIVLPIVVIIGSLLIYSILKLVRGQFFSVAFARARAVMLVADLETRPDGGRKLMEISNNLPYRIDCWFSHWMFWSFCAVVGAVVEILLVAEKYLSLEQSSEHMVTSLYAGFILGGSLWASCTIIWHTLADFKIARRMSHGELVRADNRHAVDVLQACLLYSHIDSWSQGLDGMKAEMNKWMKVMITDSRVYRVEGEQLSLGQAMNGCIQFLLQRFIRFFLVLIIVAIILHFLPVSIWQKIWLVITLCMSALTVLTIIYFRRSTLSHTFKRPGYVLFVCVIVIIWIVVLCIGFDNNNALFHMQPRSLPPSNMTGTWVFSAKDAVTPYPVCLMHWGANSELSAIDLAILSSYAYDKRDESYKKDGAVYTNTLQNFNDHATTAQIIHHGDYSVVGRVVATRFVNHDSGKNTTVLAVKGSAQPFDFYEDMKMWAMIAAFQVIDPFLNLLDLLPNWVFAVLLAAWGPPEALGAVEKAYNKLSNNLTYSNDTFILTGHSLGGGVVIAAGGHLNISAVAFSGPGSHFMRYRFGTTLEQTYRSAVNVKPQGDLIHKFDRHDEIGQYISCKNKFPNCHSIFSTICELWRVCGYDRPRNFKNMCEGVFKGTDWNKGTYLQDKFGA